MLYQGKAETIPGIKQYNMIEALTPEQLEAMPSPRILNTHFPFDHLPLDMIKRKTKIILIHRYSRTSVARTLMARLPRLFRTRENFDSCSFGLI